MTVGDAEAARNVDDLIERFVRACGADDRIVAAFLHGSHARGAADRFSDLDLAVIATDAARDEVWSDRADLVRSVGEPLFLEDFGSEVTCFFITSDGVEGELSIGREGAFREIHVGPFRPLLDRGGILEGATFPPHAIDADEQRKAVRRLLFWFWHELSHLTTALGRGHLWWAMGQLEAMRGMCVQLVRAGLDLPVEEGPYEKVDLALEATDLAPLAATFPPLERASIQGAAADVVRTFRDLARRVTLARGIDYPTELDRLMTGRFERLLGDVAPADSSR